jgi:hypothetical protein
MDDEVGGKRIRERCPEEIGCIQCLSNKCCILICIFNCKILCVD